MKKILIIFFVFSSLIFVGCAKKEASQINNVPEIQPIQEITQAGNNSGAQVPQENKNETVSIANPASTNCISKGGQLKMESIEGVGEYGVCYFEDNRQCEEWAMFRGDCPVGGLKVTGYITDAARYCVITGGEYSIKNDINATEEQGTCKFKNNKQCDALEYYNGKCSKENIETVISSATFNCKDNKTINASFSENRVTIELSDGRTLILSQGISADGARYTNSDESIVFWNKGNTAFMTENNKATFEDCIEK